MNTSVILDVVDGADVGLRKVVKMSSVCIQLLLSDVTCQTVHNINISDEVHSGRQRRQAEPLPLKQKQISEIVDYHIKLRSLEGAADMKLFVWSTELASMAASWAARCIKAHPSPEVYTEYKDINNNIYGHTHARSPKTWIDAWYSEKPGNGGHYKQVVWANSGKIGCGQHRCPNLHSVLVVCNYSPAGNYVGHSPYMKGPACSKCRNGAGWCKNKLCNSQCTRAGVNCECAAICYNCAKLDRETCRCKCAKGWRGTDCTVRCISTDTRCPKLPKTMCSHGTYGPGVRQRCPALCGVCEEDPNAKAGSCAPVRGPAAGSSAQTMFIKSHQSTMIFVMIVITFTINSYDAL